METKICQNCKNPFTITPDDFSFYEKIKIPPPTFCPECRYIRRLLDRNEYNLYRRKCDATDENIISIYRQDAWHQNEDCRDCNEIIVGQLV